MILLCGDTHGEFQHIRIAVTRWQPAAVMLLGDVQPQRPLEIELADILDRTEVWFIHGNHDTDTDRDFDNLFGSALAERNLHGRVVEIDGVRFAGLGGVFRGCVWHPAGDGRLFATREDLVQQTPRTELWRDGLPRVHHSTIFPAEYDALAEQQADVLLTHEAPDCQPGGFAPITQLGQRLGVRKAFHGHHHDRLDYSGHRSRLGFQAFGVGLCGLTSLDGEVLRRGRLDEARYYRQKAVDWDAAQESTSRVSSGS